jgi:hypothetical protein
MSLRQQDLHLSDEELVCAGDGELAAKRAAEVQAHLASCWSCRARMGTIERTIADFVRLHENAGSVPPPERARAMLRAHLAELATASRASQRERLWALSRQYQVPILALTVLAIFLLSRAALHIQQPPELSAIPDPRLTPGVALPVTRNDVCTDGAVETAHIVSPAVAQAVFASYGIRRPQPGAYEVDYLITPALGRSDNVHNFWPQSYRETVWNAHIKDALEDHLHRLVCTGELDLSTAQQDISRDWVAAYKKYFHTDRPLPEHVAFLKDRPWE